MEAQATPFAASNAGNSRDVVFPIVGEGDRASPAAVELNSRGTDFVSAPIQISLGELSASVDVYLSGFVRLADQNPTLVADPNRRTVVVERVTGSTTSEELTSCTPTTPGVAPVCDATVLRCGIIAPVTVPVVGTAITIRVRVAADALVIPTALAPLCGLSHTSVRVVFTTNSISWTRPSGLGSTSPLLSPLILLPFDTPALTGLQQQWTSNAPATVAASTFHPMLGFANAPNNRVAASATSPPDTTLQYSSWKPDFDMSTEPASFQPAALGCLLDSAASTGVVTCSLPLRGSNHARLLLSTGEASAASWMSSFLSIRLRSISSGRTRALQCDADAQREAASVVPDGRCNRLVECTTFHTVEPLDGSSKFDHIDVVIDQSKFILENTTGGRGGVGCNTTLAIALQLSYSWVNYKSKVLGSLPSTAPGALVCDVNQGLFPCPEQRTCIRSDRLGDFAKDCPQSVASPDEAVGNEWQFFASQATIACTSTAIWTATTSPATCIAAAASRLGPNEPLSTPHILFVGPGECALYDPPCVQDLMQSTRGILLTATPTVASVLYIRYGGQATACTRTYTCNGHGSAYLANTSVVGTIRQCVCFCDAGYTGQFCTQRRPLASSDGFTVIGSERSDMPTIYLWLSSVFPAPMTFGLRNIYRPTPGSNALHYHFWASTSAGTREFFDSLLPGNPVVTYGVRANYVLNRTVVDFQSIEPVVLGETLETFKCGPSSATHSACEYSIGLDTTLTVYEVPLVIDLPFPRSGADVLIDAFGSSGAMTHGSIRCNAGTVFQYIHPETGIRRTTCTTSFPAPSRTLSVVYPNDLASPPTIIIKPIRQLPALPTTPAVPIVISETPRRVSFIGGITAVSTGILCLVLAGVFHYKDNQLKEEIVRLNPPSNEQIKTAKKYPSVRQHWRWCFEVLAQTSRYDDTACCHMDKCSLLFAILATICLTSGGMFAFFYNFRFDEGESNYTGILRLYQDDQCSNSIVSPLPKKVVYVEAHARCTETMFAGDENISVAPFIRFHCIQQSDGSYRAKIGLASTLKACQKINVNGLDELPMNTCEDRGLGSTLAGWMEVACVDTETALPWLKQVEAQSRAGTDLPPSFSNETKMPTVNPALSATSSMTQTMEAITEPITGSVLYYRYRFIDENGNVRQSSSAVQNRFLSMAISDGPQPVATLDHAGRYIVSHRLDFMSAATVTMSEDDATPPSQRFLPKTTDSDVGVGRFFNGYGESETGGGRPGRGATDYIRYPNALNTAFDLATQMTEEDGPALSFWVRPSRGSRGFVLAIVDDWIATSSDDINKIHSPLLERLYAIVERGSTSFQSFMNVEDQASEPDFLAWYDHTFYCYGAVYIDGSSQSIHFVAARPGPTLEESVTVLTWNLATLGVDRFFTNTWHHVTLAFRVDRTVQLFVDAQTSFSVEGWSQCLKFHLPPIQTLAEAPIMPKSNGAIASPNATVIIGSINAGLYGIEAWSIAPDRELIANEGTQQMQNFFRFSAAYHSALAFYMLLAGFVLLMMMLVGALNDFISERNKKIEEDLKRAQSKYTKILDFAAKDVLFVTMSNGKHYPGLCFDSAKKLLGLSDELFYCVMDELEKLAVSADGAKGDMMALLWNCGRKNYNPPPTLADVYKRWAEKENSEISYDGHFVLPLELWTDFVRSHDGEASVNVPSGFSFPVMQADRARGQGQAAGRGMRGLKGLKGGKGATRGAGRGGGGGSAASGGSGSGVSGNLVVQMILPVTMAVQAMGMYMETFKYPLQYLQWFSQFFYWVSLDFFNIPGLPALMEPILQFTLGMFVVLACLYFTFTDHKHWLRLAARYLQRRDIVDLPVVYAERKKRAQYTGETVGEPPVIIEKDMELYDYMLPMFRYVLPQKVTVAIDQYFDKSRRSNIVRVKKDDLLPAVVAERGVDWEIKSGKRKEARVGVAGDTSGRSVALIHVGYRCPMHPNRRLAEVEQTDCCIKPFECFVVQNGERCPNKVGKAFACQYVNRDGTKCPFALCGDHCRTTVLEYLMLTIVGMYRFAKNVGFTGALAFACLALSAVVYFPVMRICLRFLKCDPEYQCEIPRCWSNPDRTFIIAACIVGLVTLFVGVLLPVILYRELATRKRVLNKAFHSPAYHKIYLAPDEDAEEELEKGGPSAWRQGWAFSVIRFFSKTVHSEVRNPLRKGPVVIPTRQTTVSFSEWERFLVDDDSNVFMLYMMLEYEWMTFPPFLMLYKLLILAPTIFVENNTFLQLFGSCSVELVFGLFIFWSQPYLNPWVDTMYRAGSVHNIVSLGLSAYDRVLQANGDTNGLTFTMMIVTTTYLGFVAILLFLTIVWPMVSYGARQIRVESQMNRIGLRTNDLSSLFLNPLAHEQRDVDEEEMKKWSTGFSEGVLLQDSDDEIEEEEEMKAEDIDGYPLTPDGMSAARKKSSLRRLPKPGTDDVDGASPQKTVSAEDLRKKSEIRMIRRKSVAKLKEERFQQFKKSRGDAIEI